MRRHKTFVFEPMLEERRKHEHIRHSTTQIPVLAKCPQKALCCFLFLFLFAASHKILKVTALKIV